MLSRLATVGTLTAVLIAPTVSAQPATASEPPASPAGVQYALNGIIQGTTVRQALVTSPLPFDRSYAELTPEQREALKSLYTGLAPDVEPPFPEDGLKSMSQSLIDISHRLSAPAHLVGLVNVDGNGNAKSLTVTESTNPSVTRVVGLAMMKLKYKPASCNGAPCDMPFPIRLDFAAAAGERGPEVDLAAQQRFDNNRSSPRVPGAR
ncbi:hypothetical protein BH10PSE17_BH10PSE17_09440 [soil metagenome]